MKTENQNSGGQLNLLIAVQDVEAVCDWIRSVLKREPIENTKPFAEESRLEVYFDSAEDWTTFWQHHFQTLELGRNLRIVPEWEKVPEDGRINIVINPGLSFGTGGHFTTKFCLEALEEAFQSLEIKTMIDAGTGSGILSIAAIKLGVPKVDAFDYDPICIDQCIENAERNEVGGKINFFQADVLEQGWYSEPADLVCANILTSVLLDAAPLIKRSAKKRILLSGIREIEADAVADTFVLLGCREVSRDGDGQWCGLVIDV